LEHPSAVVELHREFARAGSDVIEALTYYGHREKLKIIGKEELVEPMNQRALQMAKDVAEEFGGLLVAGNICNTSIWHNGLTEERREEIRQVFRECCQWAKDAGVDYIVGETFDALDEAMIALEVIKSFDCVAVITLAILTKGQTIDGYSPVSSHLGIHSIKFLDK